MVNHCGLCFEKLWNASSMEISVDKHRVSRGQDAGNSSLLPMEGTSDSHDASSEVSVAGLVPPLIIAVIMVTFLIVSFIRYHRKVMIKRRAQSHYIEYCATMRPQSDYPVLLPHRVGSLRAGPSIYKRRQSAWRASAKLPPISDGDGDKTASKKQSSSKGIHKFPEDNEHGKQEREPPKTYKRSAAQRPLVTADFENTGNDSAKSRRQGYKGGRKKKRNTLRRHAQDAGHNAVDSGRRFSDDNILQSQHLRRTAYQDALDSPMTQSVPNICLDNYPFYAEDTDYCYGGKYGSNDYYEDCGLAGPTARPRRKSKPVIVTAAKKLPTTSAYDRLTRRPQARPEFPELTHHDSEGKLSGRLARSLPHLEEGYYEHAGSVSSSNEGFGFRAPEGGYDLSFHDETRGVLRRAETDPNWGEPNSSTGYKRKLASADDLRYAGDAYAE